MIGPNEVSVALRRSLRSAPEDASEEEVYLVLMWNSGALEVVRELTGMMGNGLLDLYGE